MRLALRPTVSPAVHDVARDAMAALWDAMEARQPCWLEPLYSWVDRWPEAPSTRR